MIGFWTAFISLGIMAITRYFVIRITGDWQRYFRTSCCGYVTRYDGMVKPRCRQCGHEKPKLFVRIGRPMFLGGVEMKYEDSWYGR